MLQPWDNLFLCGLDLALRCISTAFEMAQQPGISLRSGIAHSTAVWNLTFGVAVNHAFNHSSAHAFYWASSFLEQHLMFLQLLTAVSRK